MTVESKLIIDRSLDSSSVLTYPYKSFYLRLGVRTFPLFPSLCRLASRRTSSQPPQPEPELSTLLLLTAVQRADGLSGNHWKKTKHTHTKNTLPSSVISFSASSLLFQQLLLLPVRTILPGFYNSNNTHTHTHTHNTQTLHTHVFSPTHLQLLQINKRADE